MSKPPGSEKEASPINLKYFQELQIDHDLAALKELSKNQAGEFSEFIEADKRKFQSVSEVTSVTKTEKAIASTASSSDNDGQNDQKANSGTDTGALSLYRGKRLSEWLKVLDNDQDPRTQGDAVKACATLYESSGQNDEIVALLKSYVKRNATSKNFLKDEDMLAGFLGFAESLEKLPTQVGRGVFKIPIETRR